MDVKEAVLAAAKYVVDMESLTSDENKELSPALQDLRFTVEGTRFDEGKGAWLIEVGFTRPWDRTSPSPLTGLAGQATAGHDRRTLKTVTISNASKKIISYGD